MEQSGRIFAIGITAHVDAGKTTLSEAMLHTAGAIKTPGRVDHGDAFLDTDQMEKERGITIFSKMARLSWKEERWILLDTPGHVDFASEAERAMSVMDAAILVISGTDGVQPHTRTLLRLLGHYRVPVFIFVNKMDLPGADHTRVMQDLNRECGGICIDFSLSVSRDTRWIEETATVSEKLLNEYLEHGDIPDRLIAGAIFSGKCFPVWFGSALRMEGIRPFMDGVAKYLALFPESPRKNAFGGRVFKIARDPQGTRLTYLRVTSGTLHAKDTIDINGENEKAEQIRLYSGAKFVQAKEVGQGEICAVTGLRRTRPGMGIGCLDGDSGAVLAPVETRTLILPSGADALDVYRHLMPLAEAYPEMHIAWDPSSRTITASLMGDIQTEIFTRMAEETLGIGISFGPPVVIYKETILKTIEGVGHFEPLRHYAEVHLLMEPGDPGSGIQVFSALGRDDLQINWQKQILDAVSENEIPGVLTGSALTDVRITLVAGKGSIKHTEGGDFREAALRAVRQGLMETECTLLEPIYSYELDIPEEFVGRAMNDLSERGAAEGTQEYAERHGRKFVILRGMVPSSRVHGYSSEVRAYTRGDGALALAFSGYQPCQNAEEVIAAAGYDPDADTGHPSSSVFCSHGAGVVVPWYVVPDYMHLPFAAQPRKDDAEGEQEVMYDGAEGFRAASSARQAAPAGDADDDFLSIYKREFGADSEEKILEHERNRARAGVKKISASGGKAGGKPPRPGKPGLPPFLIVDGYNIIHAAPELEKLFEANMDAARAKLCDLLENYHGYRDIPIAVVFDAWKVKGNRYGSSSVHNGVEVIYTRENETADSRIERMVHELREKYQITVATSDGLEQLTVLRLGALRMPARELMNELTQNM